MMKRRHTDTVLWEESYTQFETPAQAARKLRQRLVWFGASEWERGATIADLFCGRGDGLLALYDLGFRNVFGADISGRLLNMYAGPSSLVQCDCRSLPFVDSSVDIIIVQGGLHHLQVIPEDLRYVLIEVHRVLRGKGRFIAVEPWSTLFLDFVHRLCRMPIAIRLWPKLSALATMIHLERQTYTQWLRQPELISRLFDHYLTVEKRSISWGKLRLVARKKAAHF